MMQSRNNNKTGEMDSVFQLSNGDRLTYLRNLMHSFGSSYICLWTYSPHLNILYCEDGHFQVETSSSSGVSLLQTLFNQYKQSVITLENTRAVPGLAFRDKNSCLQLQESDLQSLAKGKSQRQFYLEAKIKTAIFLGCEKGEIELGIPKVRNNVSSSGLGCHPLLLENICLPSPESTDAALTKAYLEILSSPAAPPCSASTTTSPSQSTTSAFTSYHHHRTPTPSPTHHRHTLFKRAIGFYRGIHLRRIQQLASLHGGPTRPTSNQLHHMISERRRREKINDSFQALRSLLPQPTKKDKASVLRATKEYLSSLKIQVSELNKRNQLLETKLVSTTTRSKSHPLQQQADDEDETITVKLIPVPVPVPVPNDDDETIAMPIVEEELQVIFRTQTCLLPDLVIRLLEFLKQVKQVSVMSMEAQTQQTPSVAHHHQQTASPVLAHDDHQQTASPVAHHQLPTNFITLRLRIMQGVEWDESAFIEAVRRLVADFT